MKSNKGFTLIEAMIVVAIIGIMAAIVVPKFQELHQRRHHPGSSRVVATQTEKTVEKPNYVTVDIPPAANRYLVEVEVDKCQYIVFLGDSGAGSIIHKQNCKYCKERATGFGS